MTHQETRVLTVAYTMTVSSTDSYGFTARFYTNNIIERTSIMSSIVTKLVCFNQFMDTSLGSLVWAGSRTSPKIICFIL